VTNSEGVDLDRMGQCLLVK